MKAPARHTGPAGDTDPIEGYLAALTTALRGPARAKARMIEEMRDGLVETAMAYTDEGMPYRQAAGEAVREFGSPEEIAPSCQRELTIVQARHTARVAALTVPLLFACWYLVRTTGQGWQPPGAALLPAGVAATAALLASATLAATGTLARRLPTPRRLPLAVAWTGTTTAVAMALTALAFAVTSPPAVDWPLVALVAALAVASHAVIAASARVCRECARLSAAPSGAGG
ncbi:hypothetical protein SAMN04489712_10417 [Thermomonospora echinospora]|uniref:Uncharacterized protein n=1 Tax=Thermomonospora echinospora TaxID=1992 RepID=A0A1H5YJI5_9ACTN|nr:permease prefix domain 1-containing protein [Thermomonospora echinospora]SEG23536.1 hypothetical protein SAMN04489712_10417 [Thermomonospora echinospora]